MLVAGCSMLVEDPVFSGDKEKRNLLKTQHPETSIQYHGLSSGNHKFFKNLTQMLIS
jgi:hypothetical protein